MKIINIYIMLLPVNISLILSCCSDSWIWK